MTYNKQIELIPKSLFVALELDYLQLINKNQIIAIKKFMRKKSFMKIRVKNGSVQEIPEFAEMIAKQTNTKVVRVQGIEFVLYRSHEKSTFLEEIKRIVSSILDFIFKFF